MIRSIFVLLTILFGQLWSVLSGQQQITDANASWMPINYVYVIDEYDGRVRNVSVNSFYVGEQPESNRNYRCYLEAIKKEGNDSLYQAALPRIEYLRKSASRRHAEFFATEYLFDERFAHYPVLGLGLQQIEGYFKWKREQLMEAYRCYRMETGLPEDNKMNGDYRIYGQATTLSAIRTSLNRNYSPKRDTAMTAFHTWLNGSTEFPHLTPSPRSAPYVSHPALKKHGIRTVALYGLEYARERMGKDRKLTELFSSIGPVEIRTDTIYEITTLVGLSVDNRIRIKLDHEHTALLPFRYRMIDYSSTYTGKEKRRPSTSKQGQL
ncbi:hypothetical protein CEQ90_17770 [Lewinellaceae bacterium SD302]|nr:hypothetical protein CEQ90_17770 [Lewinellaceae bacterium SD302]